MNELTSKQVEKILAEIQSDDFIADAIPELENLDTESRNGLLSALKQISSMLAEDGFTVDSLLYMSAFIEDDIYAELNGD